MYPQEKKSGKLKFEKYEFVYMDLFSVVVFSLVFTELCGSETVFSGF